MNYKLNRLKQNRTYSINNCSKISSQCIFVDIFPQEIIFGGNHDFGSGATCNYTKGVPKINLHKK